MLVDAIADFTIDGDVVQIDDAVFSGGGLTVGKLAGALFTTGSSADDASDRIIYNIVTGQLFYDSDGIGGKAQVLFATVTVGLELTNGDIEVI